MQKRDTDKKWIKDLQDKFPQFRNSTEAAAYAYDMGLKLGRNGKPVDLSIFDHIQLSFENQEYREQFFQSIESGNKQGLRQNDKSKPINYSNQSKGNQTMKSKTNFNTGSKSGDSIEREIELLTDLIQGLQLFAEGLEDALNQCHNDIQGLRDAKLYNEVVDHFLQNYFNRTNDMIKKLVHNLHTADVPALKKVQQDYREIV